MTQAEAAERLGLSVRRVLEYCAAGKIQTNPPKGARFNGKPAKMLLQSDVEKVADERHRRARTAELRAISTFDRENIIDTLAEAPRPATVPEVNGPDIYYRDDKGHHVAVFISHKWISLEEASQYIGLPRAALRRRILTGKLPAIKVDPAPGVGKTAQIGDCWRVKVSDLQAIEGDIYGSEVSVASE